MIKNINEGTSVKPARTPSVSASKQMTEELEDLRAELSRQIGVETKISCSPKGGGKISIPFKNVDDLRRLISLFTK